MGKSTIDELAGDFQGKTALITGAGAGTGRDFALALAARGAAVAVTDIDSVLAAKVALEIEAKGGRALALGCDVADEAAVDTAVARTVETLGGVDILVNNAARHLSKYSQRFDKLTRKEIREMFDVNVIGVITCTLACHASMAARGGGVIINIASVAGFRSNNPYGVSKLAVRGLTNAFATEFGQDNIRVNAIAPGLVATEAALADVSEATFRDFSENVQKIKRRGEMADITALLLFLCSPSASFITGETIRCSGGSVLTLG